MATKTAKAEANIETLRSIIEHHQHAALNFTDGPTVHVDAMTANALVTVHDALSEAGQVKFRDMLKTHAGIQKLIAFAWQHVS